MVFHMNNKDIHMLIKLNKMIDKVLEQLSKLDYASKESFLKELIRLNEVRDSIASLMSQIELNQDYTSLGLTD
jgi:hypothetical protein